MAKDALQGRDSSTAKSESEIHHIQERWKYVTAKQCHDEIFRCLNQGIQGMLPVHNDLHSCNDPISDAMSWFQALQDRCFNTNQPDDWAYLKATLENLPIDWYIWESWYQTWLQRINHSQ